MLYNDSGNDSKHLTNGQTVQKPTGTDSKNYDDTGQNHQFPKNNDGAPIRNPWRTDGDTEPDKGDFPGISSDFVTYIKVLKNLMGFTFLVLPIGMREFELVGFASGFTFVLLLNLFLVWLQVKSERKFRNEQFSIYSI